MKNPYAGRSLDELKALRRDLLNTRTAHLREAERLMGEVQRVRVAMDTADRELFAVSDHAVLRWLERARGVDLNAVRAEIISHIIDHDDLGDRSVVIGGGLQVCMAENRVTTILPAAPSTETPTSQGDAEGGVLGREGA